MKAGFFSCQLYSFLYFKTNIGSAEIQKKNSHWRRRGQVGKGRSEDVMLRGWVQEEHGSEDIGVKMNERKVDGMN